MNTKLKRILIDSLTALQEKQGYLTNEQLAALLFLTDYPLPEGSSVICKIVAELKGEPQGKARPLEAGCLAKVINHDQGVVHEGGAWFQKEMQDFPIGSIVRVGALGSKTADIHFQKKTGIDIPRTSLERIEE